MDFHGRFRQAYEASPLTVKELSAKDKDISDKDNVVSQRTIENWLLKKAPTMPRIDQIAFVAKKLKVSLDWLATGEDGLSYEDRALLALARKHADLLADVDVLPADKLEFIKMQVKSVADFTRQSAEKIECQK